MRAKLSSLISVLCALALGGCLAAYEPTEQTTTQSTVTPLASTSGSGSTTPSAAPSGSGSESVTPPTQLTATDGLFEHKLERPPPHPALPDPAAESPEGQSDVTTVKR